MRGLKYFHSCVVLQPPVFCSRPLFSDVLLVPQGMYVERREVVEHMTKHVDECADPVVESSVFPKSWRELN